MKRKKTKNLKWMNPRLDSLGSVIQSTTGQCGTGATPNPDPTCTNGQLAFNGCTTGVSNIGL